MYVFCEPVNLFLQLRACVMEKSALQPSHIKGSLYIPRTELIIKESLNSFFDSILPFNVWDMVVSHTPVSQDLLFNQDS